MKHPIGILIIFIWFQLIFEVDSSDGVQTNFPKNRNLFNQNFNAIGNLPQRERKLFNNLKYLNVPTNKNNATESNDHVWKSAGSSFYTQKILATEDNDDSKKSIDSTKRSNLINGGSRITSDSNMSTWPPTHLFTDVTAPTAHTRPGPIKPYGPIQPSGPITPHRPLAPHQLTPPYVPNGTKRLTSPYGPIGTKRLTPPYVPSGPTRLTSPYGPPGTKPLTPPADPNGSTRLTSTYGLSGTKPLTPPSGLNGRLTSPYGPTGTKRLTSPYGPSGTKPLIPPSGLNGPTRLTSLYGPSGTKRLTSPYGPSGTKLLALPSGPTGPTRPTPPHQPTGTKRPTPPHRPTGLTRPTQPHRPTGPTRPTSPHRPTGSTRPTIPIGPSAPIRPTVPTRPTKIPVLTTPGHKGKPSSSSNQSSDSSEWEYYSDSDESDFSDYESQDYDQSFQKHKPTGQGWQNSRRKEKHLIDSDYEYYSESMEQGDVDSWASSESFEDSSWEHHFASKNKKRINANFYRPFRTLNLAPVKDDRKNKNEMNDEYYNSEEDGYYSEELSKSAEYYKRQDKPVGVKSSVVQTGDNTQGRNNEYFASSDLWKSSEEFEDSSDNIDKRGLKSRHLSDRYKARLGDSWESTESFGESNEYEFGYWEDSSNEKRDGKFRKRNKKHESNFWDISESFSDEDFFSEEKKEKFIITL